MLTVNIRDLSRSPKRILEEIKRTKQPRQVVSQRKPQAVIVSLEAFKDFEELKSKQKQQGSALALLKIAKMADKLKAKGPKDLSANLDKYTWDE
ncbi:type II toxin-antitoxin system Phd/YefM family antitoxin [Candidatus Daviesbacteria bacterium]|nr:type II toxin-antitoxin system Phd/YefM family antitoxin [Candidatus Daviesbacteria bacterium]